MSCLTLCFYFNLISCSRRNFFDTGCILCWKLFVCAAVKSKTVKLIKIRKMWVIFQLLCIYKNTKIWIKFNDLIWEVGLNVFWLFHLTVFLQFFPCGFLVVLLMVPTCSDVWSPQLFPIVDCPSLWSLVLFCWLLFGKNMEAALWEPVCLNVHIVEEKDGRVSLLFTWNISTFQP